MATDRDRTTGDRWPIYLARLRTPLVVAGVLVVVTAPWHGMAWLTAVGFGALAVGLVLVFAPVGAVERSPLAVAPPLSGRWIAIHSPANRVPSHGIHELGQTYAIDLIHQPDPATTWRSVKPWPPMSRPERFPSFGQPILAVDDGVVVRASGWQRDHLSRNSWLGVPYLVVEGFLRSILGVFGGYFVLGNHVVLDLGAGVYATYAHLRRRTITVRKGDRVTKGERLAECGNSGNSSEPHLHFQLTDTPRLVVAAGLPFMFEHRRDGESRLGVPRNREAFTAG